MRKSIRRTAAAFVALALVGAACSSDDSSDSTEAPADTEASADSEAPADTDAPADTEAPADTDAHADNEAPADTDAVDVVQSEES
ncbi:MAG: ABC transporter substrate-binding protein, partial [Acidimicrobiia bacterium]|nr:ABC transporter substrate-binding protein [Acidimicrobiia bacterium]